MTAAVCAFCSHANPAGSSFCNDCGSSLRLALCAKCEAVNDRAASNCHKCGAQFSSTSSTAGDANDLPRNESAGPSPSSGDRAAPTEAKAASPRQRRSAALAALPLIVLAGATYYVYRSGDVKPSGSSSHPESPAISSGSGAMGAANVHPSDEREDGAERRPTNSADALAAPPGIPSPADDPAHPIPVDPEPNLGTVPDQKSLERQRPDEPRQAAEGTAKSADDGARRRPQERDARRDRSVSTAKPDSGVLIPRPTQRAPNQDVSARFQPPLACTDAVAALGLCNRNKLEEGK
jgi:hypothetical protein